MSLQDEIDKKTGEIYRESYQMSIGELVNLYRDGEMDIHPEFQRVYRWSEYQKTKLIESLMLNIPIPPIYVSQSDEGIWDVIDGVQRLSTIFQFFGVLMDDNNKSIKPLVLLATENLPSFAGMTWDSDENNCFTRQQQLLLKRSRLDITILKKESDANKKYELFQRLNTGGSFLSDQEVRNCLIIMSNRDFYLFLDELKNIQSFEKCLPITDRKADEQYYMEMIVRLLVAYYMDMRNVGGYTELSELLDKEILKICISETINTEDIKKKFLSTFNLLYGLLEDDVFKKYNGKKFSGPFLSAAFQAIAIGVYSNIDEILAKSDKDIWLIDKIKKLYEQDVYNKNTAPGAKAIPRFKELTQFGLDYFK